MSKNGLYRHYDKLEPEERFRLDVLAMARGDGEESERLVRSCPRYTYTMTDRAFGWRWAGALELTPRMYLQVEKALAKLAMVEAFRAVIPYSQNLAQNAAFDAYLEGHEAGSRHAWGYAGMEGSPPAWPDDGPNGELMEPDEDERDPAMEREMDEIEERVARDGELLPELMDRMEPKLAAEALGLWTCFEDFCEERMGVGAEKVLKAIMEPAAERIEHLKDLAQRLEVEPDPEVAAGVREELDLAWEFKLAKGI